ncbi:twin-arginine translocation signal domain-containing protein [Roseomonas marmotae]|uniref:Twin-arginine translocation signal domain-containing protein n=1 Tax=Roseomonas marmotae TaxID=2768161 RepID=A0ABS3KCD8_9PROT|nr:twin-arginine translocation signal domain-containing protein [Roseomonas marmotae]MBO1075105.1 twin-arginine translocation signal domain-containing protein [Roseomonas marmotae]QTI79780.1 twin-arginine translocation signal domain-containing protein [Roseomonas marmotae]
MSEGESTGRRRSFLKTLGLAGGAAVAATAPAAAFNMDGGLDGVRPDKEKPEERVATRYRETEHVKAFYRTNRY